MTTQAQPAQPQGADRPPPFADLPLAPGTSARVDRLALRHSLELDAATALLDHVVGHARARPDRCAIVDGERRLSYRDLLARVAATRGALLDHGVGAGDVVAAVGPRSAETPIVYLALESLGAAYLPIDPAWPRSRVRDVLDRGRVSVLVDYSRGGRAEAARAAADDLGARTLTPPTEDAATLPLPEPDGADRRLECRYVIFTSGTTGRPKGAMVQHQGLMNHLWSKVDDLALGPEDALAFTAPLVFDISIWQMLCPLLVGGRVVVLNDVTMRLPRWLVDALDDEGVTVLELVPTVIGWLTDEVSRREDGTLGRLRWLLSTGEELHAGVAARALDTLPRVSVVNAYGPSECSDDVTLHTVTRADLGRPRLPVGSPVANTALYVLVQEADGVWRAAEPGEDGELFIGGAGVGLGYLNDPATTAGAFFRDPFDPASPTGRIYRTGDRARVEDGLVHYLGRVDRQVKVSGVRMELDEIEAVLGRHPDVERCAVTVAGAGELAELVAHYSVRGPVTPDGLRRHLADALPPAMVPRRWREWETLPLTHNGKIDLRSLAAATATSGTGKGAL
ncbi:amino acid adenylation domain-containing protein [Streptomyces alkaliterrae]|uniref:Amino acid adenylation domain-containing protein n=1 Tax=Streptomyces alkaliterrae TaxID=2213162 RepID=A0A7W3WW15_9ACTN|nr:amino acid adenylation domain-containing protein [Streptomyces alkaliterrae]MBB1259275.1 amino acid adenylation domain-containing protein [Streptomyces alkaliterrae]